MISEFHQREIDAAAEIVAAQVEALDEALIGNGVFNLENRQKFIISYFKGAVGS